MKWLIMVSYTFLLLYYFLDFYNNFDEHEDHDAILPESSVKNDPEYVEYSCLDVYQVQNLFEKNISELVESISVPPTWAKIFLYSNNWSMDQIKKEYSENNEAFLSKNFIRAEKASRKRPRVSASNSKNNNFNSYNVNTRSNKECSVCCDDQSKNLISLDCLHYFCQSCWVAYLNSQLFNGMFCWYLFLPPFTFFLPNLLDFCGRGKVNEGKNVNKYRAA